MFLNISHNDQMSALSRLGKKASLGETVAGTTKEPQKSKEEIYIQKIKSGEIRLFNIPEEDRTHAICLAAVEKQSSSIQYVPPSLQTPELYLTAVSKDATCLRHIPVASRTEEMYLITLRQSAASISDFPHLSEQFYMTAIKDNCLLISDFLTLIEQKKTEWTEEICAVFIESQGAFLQEILQKIPDEFKTPNIYLAAVKSRPHVFKCIPDDQKTAEMSLIAVKKGEVSLDTVPMQFRTEEICSEAIANSGCNLQYVPQEQKTEEICITTIRRYPSAIIYIPDELKTDEFYLKAIKNNPEILRYISSEIQAKAYCLDAVEKFYLDAVKKNGHALQYIPTEALTEEIVVAAIEECSSALQYVPSEKCTIDLCQKTLQRIPIQFGAVNHILKNYPELKAEILEKLSQTQHIMVSNSIFYDDEVKDGIAIYGSHKKRLNKTIHVETVQELSQLSKILSEIPCDKVNLVLIGHANPQSKFLAMSVPDIATVCKQLKNIDRVTLLGCKTAQIHGPIGEVQQKHMKFQEQQELRASFKGRIRSGVNLNIYSEEFQIECSQRLLNQNYSDIYIVNKISDEDKQNFQFIHVARLPNGDLNIQVMQEDTDLEKIKSAINVRHISFPPKMNTLCHDKSFIKDNIKYEEIDNLYDTIFPYERFNRQHSDYESDKILHPFLTSVQLTESEVDASLQESLLKTLYEQLKKEAAIERPIMLKAYCGVLSVDKENSRFYVSNASLYRSKEYTQNAIDLKKLKKERKNAIDQLKRGAEISPKAVKVFVNAS